MVFFVSFRPRTIVMFNERNVKCHFKAKHSIPPNSQGREGASRPAGIIFVVLIHGLSNVEHMNHRVSVMLRVSSSNFFQWMSVWQKYLKHLAWSSVVGRIQI